MCKVKQPKVQEVKADPVPQAPPAPSPVATVITPPNAAQATDETSLAIRKSKGASKLSKARASGTGGKAPTVDKTGSGASKGASLGIGTIKR